MTINKALFLDRDGVINIDYGYVYEINKFIFIDGIFDLTLSAQKKNYKIIIVTNQAGIGRGYYSEKDFHLLNSWMCESFLKKGISISKVYFCKNHPDGIGQYKKQDFRRKPNPGMFIEAKNEFNLDMSSCLLVGDQLTDIEAGLSADIGCNILFGKKNIGSGNPDMSYKKVSNLSQINAFL